MKTNHQLYYTYKLVNKLLSQSILQDLGGNVSIRLSPLKYILNRTHYHFWVEGVEQISVTVQHPVCLDELKIIEEKILSNINMILKCVEMENYKEVKKVEVLIN
jgi:hypothetical protein